MTIDPDTRGLASSIVAVAAESTSFPDFCFAAIEPLFASIGPMDMDDNSAMAARDNSLSARE